MTGHGRFGLSANALGSLYMIIGSLGYVVNDGFIRAATEEGSGVYQALCLRAIAMAVLFAAVGRGRRERLVIAHVQAPLVVRVVAEMAAAALFFGALVHVEFANAQTILLIVPFAVTLAAAAVLGETVTARHYATILVGFVGVVIVVRPATDQFSAWSLVVVVSAVCLVVRELATRRVPGDVPALSIALVTAVGLAFLTGALSIFGGWGPIGGRAVVFVGLACCCLFVGYLFTIQTVRVGDLSVSAPFRYTTLPGAVVVGYLLFDEVPDALTVTGSVIIVLTGVYAVHLERTTVDARSELVAEA